MPHETFEVGDRVFLTSTRQFGTIVKVILQRPHSEPEIADGSSPGRETEMRLYDIELDSGRTLNGVYHGIEHASD